MRNIRGVILQNQLIVRSFYETYKAQSQCLSLAKAIWRVKAPWRVSFFGWTSTLVKTLTCENLIKRGYSMVSRCCMYCCSGETVDRLLIHCSVAFELLSFTFRTFGIQWVLPEKILDLLCGWQSKGPNIWNLIPLYLMWIKCLTKCSITTINI